MPRFLLDCTCESGVTGKCQTCQVWDIANNNAGAREMIERAAKFYGANKPLAPLIMQEDISVLITNPKRPGTLASSLYQLRSQCGCNSIGDLMTLRISIIRRYISGQKTFYTLIGRLIELGYYNGPSGDELWPGAYLRSDISEVSLLQLM